MYQVSFLPWITFDESISIGPITFWPYYKEAESRIHNPEIKAHLDRYFSRHVDHKGNSVKSITVCSHGEDDFHVLSDLEQVDVNNAVNALAFSTIAPRVKNAVTAKIRSWGPPTSDVFELATQNFHPGIDDISVRAGSLLSAGLKIDEISFSKPWATGGMAWPPSSTLLEGFDNCFSPALDPTFQQRIFRSLEWFVMAHLEDSPVSQLAKIVMMATGFEILLQFGGKKWNFVRYIESNIATDKFLTGTRSSNSGSNTFTLAGCWAWDYYQLRNRIVHGEVIQPAEFAHDSGWSHAVVADVIFLECIKRDMLKNGCIREGRRKEWLKTRPDMTEEESLKIAATVMAIFDFQSVHEALGWIDRG